MIESDFLKGFVDAGTGTLNILDSLIDKFGVLKTAIVGVAAGSTIKSIAWPKITGDKLFTQK